MNTPPRDLEKSTILAALDDGWGIRPQELRYTPLGFGSHHWTAWTTAGERWWITVDDLRASHLQQAHAEPLEVLKSAFRVATSLRDSAHLRFVVGPLPARGGEMVRGLGDRYAISVVPYLDVEPVNGGAFRSREDRDEALRLVGQIHNATPVVPLDTLRWDTLVIQDRDRLLEALDALDERWTGGPYGEPARVLLRDSRDDVLRAIDGFDALAGTVVSDMSGWVVTHGEPHASNVIRTRAGELVLVDWDTVASGPRERDLWMLIDDDMPDWDAYREVTGVIFLSETALAAYRLHWSLSEIATFTAGFTAEHERTEDAEVAWTELERYVKDLC